MAEKAKRDLLEELRKLKEEGYDTIANLTGDIIVRVDEEGCWTYLNDTACEFWDGSREELLGRSFADYLHPGDMEKTFASVLKTSQSGSLIKDLVNRQKTPLGWRFVQWNATPLYRDGKYIGFQSTGRDITRYKQMEESLRESEEKHRRLFETMSQGVLYQLADGHIFSANPAAERILGLSLDQLKGKTSMDPRWKMITEEGERVPGDEHPAMLALKTGEIVGPVTRGVFIPERNEYVWLSVTATPLFLPGEDKPYQVYAVIDDITAKKRNEEKLRKQQRLTTTILEKLPIGIAVNTMEPMPKVELINDNFTRIYDLNKDSLSTTVSFWEAAYEDEHFREKLKSRVFSDMESGDPERMQWPDIPITKNGKIVRYVSARNIPLEEEGLMISTVMDVTKRKQAEEELLKSKDKAEELQLRFKTLFEKSPVSIIIHDKDSGEVIDANQAGFIAYGFNSLEELQANNFWGESPYSATDALNLIRKASREGTQVFEWKSIKTSGETFWELVTLTPITIDNVERILATSIDITRQKQKEQWEKILYEIANATFVTSDLEELIAQIKEHLSGLINTSNFYIALYDKDSGMLSIPYEHDEKDNIYSWLADKSMTGLVVKEGKAWFIHKREIEELVQSGKIDMIGNMCEVWLGVPLFMGQEVIGAIVVQDYHDPQAYNTESREILEFISNQVSLAIQRQRIFEDLVKAKDKAQESDRLKSAFLANMSHEIRTPMNGIMGFAELLQDPNLSDEQQRKYFQVIERSGDRLLNVIDDIVDVSRIEAGLIDLNLAGSNINDQLEYVYNFFEPEAKGRGLKLDLSVKLPHKWANVYTDREKLFAVLTNLVKNAIKYTPRGRIEFGCRKEGSFYKFFVRDTGIGIPGDRRQAIFDRFVQADIEDKQAMQGVGLGLSISKAYVEMLGGQIWVESEPGKGSVFYFTIPVH
ncbi:MAG: PAS domain S-box protein [Bacteroidales bacterium]